jgi:NADP-dependent 3-hydroxy acid dehydrogenase YdfG
MKRFENQTAIVTGASSGIGRAIALALAQEGAHIALAARREELLEEVAGEIRNLGSKALVVPTDVTDRDQIRQLVHKTIDAWNHVDIVVANAGLYVRAPIRDLTVHDVERSMAVNFYGNLYLVLELLPHLLEKDNGHILLMATFDAKKGLPPDTPYVVAKSALASFGEVLRQELANTGISVTTVFPGRVDTSMIGELQFHWISRKISPDMVASATLRGIHMNRPEVIVPWYIRFLHYIDTLFPRWGDRLVRIFHLQGWDKPQ